MREEVKNAETVLDSIPPHLELPPDVEMPPPATAHIQELPFDQLSWTNFERLCVRLAREDTELEHARLYGTAGQDQDGIDLFARIRSTGQYRVFQCKREKGFSAAKISAAVKEFREGDWSKRASSLVLCTMESLRSTERLKAVESERTAMETAGFGLLTWDADELSALLKKYPEIVHDFFGREWVKRFNGEDAADRLKSRLDVNQTAKLRNRLHSLYQAIFTTQDPGLPTGPDSSASAVPLEARFVQPDITEEREPAASPLRDVHAEVGDVHLFHFSPRNLPPRPTVSTSSAVVRRSAEGWLGESNWQIVIGGPGSGKTAFLRFIVLDLFSNAPTMPNVAKRWGARLPVWVPFAYWSKLVEEKDDDAGSLASVLKSWLRLWSKDSELWPLVQSALEDDRLLLCVDGLDEWSSEGAAGIALQRLQVFARLCKTPVVGTSRPYGLERLALRDPEWRIGVVAPFSRTQQREFSEKYLSKTTDPSRETAQNPRPSDFLSDLWSNSDLEELARTPLLLGILAYLWRFERALPDSRFAAYDRLVQHLLVIHPKHRLTASQVASDLGVEGDVLRSAAAALSLHIQREHPQGACRAVDASKAIASFLQDDAIGLGLDPAAARERADAIVNYASDTGGLLVRRSPAEVSFFHRALQEYLCGEALSRLPAGEQRKTVSTFAPNPQWHEVLLCLIGLQARPDDARGLVEAVRSANRSKVDEMECSSLLTAIAFGNSRIPASLARELASIAFDAIEQGHHGPTRERLVKLAVRGLRSQRVRDQIASRLHKWFPASVQFKSSVYVHIAKWPLAPQTTRCLIRGLASQEVRDSRAAGQSLATFLGRAQDVFEEAFTLAVSSVDPNRRAAAIEAVAMSSRGGDEKALQLYADSASSASPNIQVAAIKGLIISDRQTRDDLERLLRLLSWSGDLDHSWSSELPRLIAKRWAGDSELKQRCLESLNERSFGSSVVPRPDTAREILIRAFPGDDEVATVLAAELEASKHIFGTARFELWSALAENFKDNPHLTAAIDKWMESDPFYEPDLTFAAQLGRTPVAKRTLLSHLNRGFPHWPAQGLLDGWGMADDEVREALQRRISDMKGVAELAPFMSKIVPDSAERSRLLLQALSDPGCRRPDFVLSALTDLRGGQTLADSDVVAAALQHADDASVFDVRPLLVAHYSADERVRALAMKDIVDGSSDLIAAAAAGYGGDDEMMSLIVDRLEWLPDQLRNAAVRTLGTSLGHDPVAISLLAEYRREKTPSVRSRAAISYYSCADFDRSGEWARLTKDVAAMGFTLEAVRAAALCGLIVLGESSIVSTLTEANESKTPLSIPLTRFDVNYPALELIVERWSELKGAIGPDPIKTLARTESTEVDLWSFLAPLVEPASEMASDLLSFATSRPEARTAAPILRAVARLKPASELLKTLCVESVRFDQIRSRSMPTLWQRFVAAEIIGRQFAKDETLRRQVGDAVLRDPMHDAALVALCTGWPESEALEDAFQELKRTAAQVPAAIQAQVVFTKSSTARADELLRSIVDHSLSYWEAVSTHRVLIRRVNADGDLGTSLSDALRNPSATPSQTASFSRILASSRAWSAELKQHCRERLEKELVGPPDVGFDLVAGFVRPVAHSLMDVVAGPVALA